MIKLISIVPALLSLTLLASCGGGGNESGAATTPPITTTPPAIATPDASRYVGTWADCFQTGAATSTRETVVISAQSSSSVTFSNTETPYATLACAGKAGSPVTTTGSVTFNGTKTVGTDTVDKGIVTEGTNAPRKQIFLVTATTLKSGRSVQDGGSVDADGYPTSFDSGTLGKQ